MGGVHAATRVAPTGGVSTDGASTQRAENPVVHEAPAGFSTQTGQHTAGKATAAKATSSFPSPRPKTVPQ